MKMTETNKMAQFYINLFERSWNSITAPHPSIKGIGEQRSARLSISIILAIGLLIFAGFIAGAQQTGYADSFNRFAVSLITFPISFLLAKSKTNRAGVFLFSLAFGASAYVNVFRQGSTADVATNIFIYVPLSLIVASTFLSSWAVFLLTGLFVSGVFLFHINGLIPPQLLGGLAGIITTLGIVLILLNNFRKKTETLRLEEVQNVNRELEKLSNELEQRVEARAFELDKANQQTSRRAAQLQAITELSESIAQLQDLNEVFPAATKLISERFGFYHVGIFLVDKDRTYAILQAANSEGGKRMLARSHRLALGTGVVGFSAKNGRPRIALDVGTDAVFFDNPDLPETRSEAALPLNSRGETIGVLDVQSTVAGAFSNEDLQVLTALANQVSIALENARLLTETRAALAQVQEVYNEFTRTEWSRTVSRSEQSGFRYQTGRVELLENELHHPEVVSAVQNRQVVANQSQGSNEKRASVAVPVKLRGEVIGILHIESNDPSKTWQEDEISLVEAVAERAAFAMENARLFQDARRRAAKEQLISESTSRISGAFNMENILQTTAEELERVLGGSEILIQFQGKESA